MSRQSETFGRERVVPQERERLIRRVFSRVAPRYDLMNDLMSFGIHRLWKRSVARLMAPAPGQVIVDLAGGTGDVAGRLAGSDRVVIVCDPSLEMMNAGRSRQRPRVSWLGGIAEALPLANDSADSVVMTFGIRNFTHMDRALGEILRVLKPGGQVFCLEFSQPAALLRPFYQAYSRFVIPGLGAWVSRNRDAYVYLIESIEGFPDQEEMKALFEQAGFVDVSYRNYSFGIACLHTGVRPVPLRVD